MFRGGLIFVDFVDDFIHGFMSPRKGVYVHKQIHEQQNENGVGLYYQDMLYHPTSLSLLCM